MVNPQFFFKHVAGAKTWMKNPKLIKLSPSSNEALAEPKRLAGCVGGMDGGEPSVSQVKGPRVACFSYRFVKLSGFTRQSSNCRTPNFAQRVRIPKLILFTTFSNQLTFTLAWRYRLCPVRWESARYFLLASAYGLLKPPTSWIWSITGIIYLPSLKQT